MTDSEINQLVESRVAALMATAEQRMATRVDQQIQQKLSQFTIQSGQGVQVSGSGENITVSLIPTSSGVGAPGGGGNGPFPGATEDLTVCRDNGDTTFTQLTGHWVNGILASVD